MAYFKINWGYLVWAFLAVMLLFSSMKAASNQPSSTKTGFLFAALGMAAASSLKIFSDLVWRLSLDTTLTMSIYVLIALNFVVFMVYWVVRRMGNERQAHEKVV